MSETYKPAFEAHIPISIEDEEIDLTYENTVVYEFGHGHEAMNHPYVRAVGQKAFLLYHHPELVEQLIKEQYPRVFTPEPNEEEQDSYVKFQTAMLDQELDELDEED